jgi:translation initiation factor 2A
VCAQVWDVSTGAVVFEVGSKSVHKEAWPLLHWGTEDQSLFHGVTNTVHQYSRADGFKGECRPWPESLGCLATAQHSAAGPPVLRK